MFNPKEGNLLDQQLAVSGLEMNNFVADLFTGGGYSRNKASKKAADRQNKYNREVYEFQYGPIEDEDGNDDGGPEDGTATDCEDGDVGGRTSVASGETVSDQG